MEYAWFPLWSKCVKVIYVTPSGNTLERPSQPPLKLRRSKNRWTSSMHLLSLIAPVSTPRADHLGSPNPPPASARIWGCSCSWEKAAQCFVERLASGSDMLGLRGSPQACSHARSFRAKFTDGILKAQSLNVLLFLSVFFWKTEEFLSHSTTTSKH